MPLKIINSTITMAIADVIVNSANIRILDVHNGVEEDIYKNAGVDELQAERKKVGIIETGCVAPTPSCRLEGAGIKRIYHAVCVPWIDGHHLETEILRCCYLNSLRILKKEKFESISFPLLGAGALGFPTDVATTTAILEINYFLKHNPSKRVYLAIPDERLFEKAKNFQEYVESGRLITDKDISSLEYVSNYPYDINDREGVQIERIRKIWNKFHNGGSLDLDEKLILGNRKLRFENLIQLFASDKNLPLSALVNDSVIEKTKLSRIINRETKDISKETVLAIGIFLKLSVSEMEALMESAGYSFADNNMTNIIVKDFIEKKDYSVVKINMKLAEQNLPLLK